MDAATLGVIGAFAGALVVGLVAFYGHRVQNRTGLMTTYNSLTDQLQEERADLRQQLAGLRAELSAERTARAAVEAENAALRAQVISLGGAAP